MTFYASFVGGWLIGVAVGAVIVGIVFWKYWRDPL